MEVVMGAVGSLLPKLGRLLMDECKLQKEVKENVESLVREMKSMHAALSKVAEVPWYELDSQVKNWADDVRELSYDMEDVVDNFLVCAESSDPATNSSKLKELTQNMVRFFTQGHIRHQIADAIKDIRSRAQEVADLRAKYKVDDIVANLASKPVVDPRMLALYKDQKELIGIEDPQRMLTERLADGDGDGDGDVSKKQLKIVSVFGFGGLGKTTLAKAMYDSLEPKFDCGAFVSVGRNPDVTKVFKDIVLEIEKRIPKKKHMPDAATLDVKQLIDRLRWQLQKSRYFIVIDDIWDLRTWEIVKCALVENNRGSRIITTTHILEVASKTGDVYQLQPLSNSSSEKLFYSRLFGGKSKCPYDLPVEVTNKILRKCGGVPLAIITIASLLVGKPLQEWSKVYNAIGFGDEDNIDVENTRKILSFSFYDLPCHLRTCLLQLCIFPEDCLILKDPVIWKWIAEGFVREEPGVGLFEIGERYFSELINKSMIQAVEEPDKYTIYACRVHDMVLDMICLLSKEQNFITILDSNNDDHTPSHSSARWLAVQKRTSAEQQDPLAHICMPKLRSFCATMCNISRMSPLTKFQVLRVLVMQDCTFMQDRPYNLKHLGKLVQLRYLGLENTPILELPEEVGNLQLLQTLELKGSKIQTLPDSVGSLKRLKRMRADCCGTAMNGCNFVGVLRWLGNLASLEELYLLNTGVPSIFVEELSKLTELRVLSILINEFFGESSKKALVECLGSLQKLQVLTLQGGGWSIRDAWSSWKGFAPPKQLRDLLISVTFRRLPAWINSSRLPNLSSLSMTVSAIEARDVDTLGRFPELVSLELKTPSDLSTVPLAIPGDNVCFSDSVFPKLRSCYMHAPFKFEEGAMSSLESLKFEVEVQSLDDDDAMDFSSLGNLPCLKKVQAAIACRHALASHLEEVEASMTRAAHVHPNRPILVVTKSDECEVIYDEEAWNDAQSDFTRGFCPSKVLEDQYAWNLLATRNKQPQQTAALPRLAEATTTSTSSAQVISDKHESGFDSEHEQADEQPDDGDEHEAQDRPAGRLTVDGQPDRLTDHSEAVAGTSPPVVPVPRKWSWRRCACFN